MLLTIKAPMGSVVGAQNDILMLYRWFLHQCQLTPFSKQGQELQAVCAQTIRLKLIIIPKQCSGGFFLQQTNQHQTREREWGGGGSKRRNGEIKWCLQTKNAITLFVILWINDCLNPTYFSNCKSQNKSTFQFIFSVN